MDYQNCALAIPAALRHHQPLPECLSNFFLSVSSTEACCNNCQKKIKFSTKATSNLITHLKRCSPQMHQQYTSLKTHNNLNKRKLWQSFPVAELDKHFQPPVKCSPFQPITSNGYVSPYDVHQRAITKALLKSVVHDELPLDIVKSPTFTGLLWVAEPTYVVPNTATIETLLVPTVSEQMEELMRRDLSCLPRVYLTADLWTSHNMATCFLAFTVHFIDADWKPRRFVLAAKSYLRGYAPADVGKAYTAVVDKFELATKVTKVVSDNVASMRQSSKLSLPGFALHHTDDEEDPDDEEFLITEDADLDTFLAHLPQRVSSFTHRKQLCLRDGLHARQFVQSCIGEVLEKVSNLIGCIRKSVTATLYLRGEHINLVLESGNRWNRQLDVVQFVLTHHKEVNTALNLIPLPDKITPDDHAALSEFVNVLLPFQQAMHHVAESGKIVTSSCICPIVVGLCRALKHLNGGANLTYCTKLAVDLQASVYKRLCPLLNCVDNRLAALLDPRFKNKWIEDRVEREQAYQMLVARVADRFTTGDAKQTSRADNDADEKTTAITQVRTPSLLGFLDSGLSRKVHTSEEREVDSYLREDIIHTEEDPLLYWREKADEFPRLSALAKDYLGLTATSSQTERLSMINGDFCKRNRNLLGTDVFDSLMFIKCNLTTFDNVAI